MSAIERGIDVIDRNAAAQRAIIDELLDVSRIITGKLKLDPKPIDPASVIDAAVDAIRPAAMAKEIEVVASVERNRGLVVGEAVRLQQVIWNLLSNAVKFTQEWPCGNPPESKGQVFRNRNQRYRRRHRAEFVPYIFERFRQADTSSRRKHGGLGVGLSIVRSLVELHNGWVRVASDGLGKGATFTIGLPVMGLSDADGAHLKRCDPFWRCSLEAEGPR